MKKKRFILSLLALGVALAGCTQVSPEVSTREKPAATSQVQQTKPISEGLVDNRSVYEQDVDGSLVYLYVTVVNEENEGLKTTTFKEINQSPNGMNEKGEDLKAKVIMQEGTVEGPVQGLFGYGETRANGSIELRGESSRKSEQKSYKIRLYDKAGYWRDQRNINLNKHKSDLTRVRQKLSFDYFEQIPHMTSLRTQFVNLRVKDLTGKNPDKDFVDYGLFTQVEQPNKTFLQSHGLDRNGNLYKAISFEFHRYEDIIKLATDPDYDKKAFETLLEIKGSEDHEKLISMLDDLHNPAIKTTDFLDKHFDRDNYYTWLASNILFGNADNAVHNFYLYSPSNSTKWYFLPWDYDGSWGKYEGRLEREPEKAIADWQFGFSTYWVSKLFSRVFKDPDNVKALNEKVEEVSKIVTKEQTEKYVQSYYPIASKYVMQRPDLYNLPEDVSLFEVEYAAISLQPEQNKKRYFERLEKPMPFFMSEPRKEGDMLVFSWEHSYDLQGDDLTYEFAVSYDPAFTKRHTEVKGLTGVEYKMKAPGKGRFFWRVMVRDSKGNTQTSFDKVEPADAIYHGVKEFVLK
ncbi:CotH kinase family protein [Brevibacillus fortis]|uniref:Spore coat protein n=1 Tax=Brevibacillus fortis TaxID=2126352 RepID=A0A2P7UQU1_9BACL|nr:CotH kinase family protein [Brevibacillus fortis]PSJ89366.1 spore coat protein [Brevibacillus fortis]